jgi:hypothetical protein
MRSHPVCFYVARQMPLGYFDPLGLLKDADEETFVWWRTAESKHGRIAMLAVLGHITTASGVRVYPLPEAVEGVPGGLGAFFGPHALPVSGAMQIVLLIGLGEMGYTSRQAEIEKVHLDKSKWDAKTIDRKKAIELNNGRAAMMGIWGLVTHELIDGHPYVINGLIGLPSPTF